MVVDGFRARVITDYYFHNDKGRQLEGSFQLRLPTDASLYYFAFGETNYQYRAGAEGLVSRTFLAPELVRSSGTGPEQIVKARGETWSSVKEARVVPKEKAAHAYSEVVRRRVDPALVEWAGAGVFNSKVFPLQPGKLHRIVVGYDVNLQAVDDGLQYRLELPENVAEQVIDLNLAAIPGASAEVLPAAAPFTSGGRAFYHWQNPEESAVTVQLSSANNHYLVGSDQETGDYFAARVTPDLPADDVSGGNRRAIFAVDTSLSSQPDKFNVWLKLLSATLTENRGDLEQFAVLFFNVEAHWWQEQFVDNNAKNVDDLMAFCNELALEGATDLRLALAEAAAPAWRNDKKKSQEPADLFLLSDGAASWGEGNLHLVTQPLKQQGHLTLFAYKTGLQGTATETLAHLARETGGAVFSITTEEEVAKVATAHRKRPWRLLDVGVTGGRDVLVAGRPTNIYPGQTLQIVGRGRPDGEALVRVQRGGKQQTLTIPLGQSAPSTLTARMYGQVAVGQLEQLADATRNVSVAYARHFRVSGQTCSLLMLESEEDYQRFKIKPEEDVMVVRSSVAADVIAKKVEQWQDRLADPKSETIEWLKRLQQTPGVQFTFPTALEIVLDEIPSAAFETPADRLECEARTRSQITNEYLSSLSGDKLAYLTVTEQAERRRKKFGPDDAVKALSSFVEQNPGDVVLAQDVAYSALEWKQPGQALPLLKRVVKARPYQPHTYQAIGRCLAEMDRADLAILFYEVAVTAKWNNRYHDVNQIAGVEYLHLLRRIAADELTCSIPEYAAARLERLKSKLDVTNADLVITMLWNTDRTDVDLHVLEPSGEECFYKNRSTRAGGTITRDVTEGFGPEMYSIRKAARGDYKIMANYFGSDQNKLGLRTKVLVTVYENFGDPKKETTSRHYGSAKYRKREARTDNRQTVTSNPRNKLGGAVGS